MGKKFAGTCYIKANGALLSVEGSVEIPLLKTTKEKKVGSTGVAGYSETNIAPYVKCTAFLEPDFDIDALSGNDMTITAELANGWVYTLNGAWLEGEVVANSSDGTVSLEFTGLDGHLQR